MRGSGLRARRTGWTSAVVAVLSLAATLVYAVTTLGSDATASRRLVAPSGPAIAIVSSPKVQALETKIVAKLDAKTQVREPVLVLGTARFRITVKNAGPVNLRGVTVTDPLSPDCSRKIGRLDAGASIEYFCSAANVGRDYTNTVTASGRSADDARVLTQASATSTVKVKPKRAKKKKKKKRAHLPHVAFTG
jgi:uncharacterized repeat protein (TIGR01451 family)